MTMDDAFKDMTLDEAMANPFWDDVTVTTSDITIEGKPYKSFVVALPSDFEARIPPECLSKDWQKVIGDMLDERIALDLMEVRAVMRWKAKLMLGGV